MNSSPSLEGDNVYGLPTATEDAEFQKELKATKIKLADQTNAIEDSRLTFR